MLSKTLAVALGATSLSFLGANAQDVPFLITGAYGGAYNDSAAYNSGGGLTVSGRSIMVPKNLQVQFPAAFVGFRDFASGSGSYTGYEMEVVGNVVNGQRIAAQVSIAPFMLEGDTGYVDSVEYDGRIKIRGGPTIRINDPNAVYSAGYTAHPFFTADDANPSITSFSGFPMCVPRSANDEKCPQSNRPNVPGRGKQGTFRAPDALVMAPIVPGDYLEYSGIQVGGEVIVYSMVVSNVQITTTGVPTYIRMEDAIIGIWTDNTNDQEIAQIRFIGVTSDGSANVNPLRIYAMDVDPCTGKITDREIAATSMIANSARNKFEYRVKAPQNSAKTREYRIVAGTGTRLTKNGILAGSYIQPVTEWIQPEATTPGLEPFVNDFTSMHFLTKGLGYDEDGNLWGPLSPFPQSGVTTNNPAQCPPFVPPSDDPPVVEPPTTPPPTTPPPVVYKDVVTMPTLTWVSSNSGTLTVDCRSNNTNDNAVDMTLSYTNKNGQTSGVAMVASGGGLWKFSNRSIKEPTVITCTSKLGGTVTRNR